MERRLAEEDVGPGSCFDQALARIGVTGVGQHPGWVIGIFPRNLDAQGVGLLNRVQDRVGNDRERTKGDGLARRPVLEIEVFMHAWIKLQPVRGSHPVGSTSWPPHRNARPVPAVGIPVHRHVQSAQVHAVVWVKVTQEHCIDVPQVHIALQGTQSTIAEIQQDPPGPGAITVGHRGSDQIARRRRLGTGKGPAAAHNSQLHDWGFPIASARAEAIISGVIRARLPVGYWAAT